MVSEPVRFSWTRLLFIPSLILALFQAASKMATAGTDFRGRVHSKSRGTKGIAFSCFSSFFFSFFFWHVACGILKLFPDQGLNTGPQQWKCRVLTIPGISLARDRNDLLSFLKSLPHKWMKTYNLFISALPWLNSEHEYLSCYSPFNFSLPVS